MSLTFTERRHCYVTFLGGKPDELVHLRGFTFAETLCGLPLRRAYFSTGGIWHPDAPPATCPTCVAKAAA